MPITTFTAAELSRLGGFNYSNKASQAVATKLNALGAEVVNNFPLAPTADTVSSAVGIVNQAFASKVTIPAGALVAGSRLVIRAGGTCTASAGAVNLTLTLKIGATTIAACSAFDPAAGTPQLVGERAANANVQDFHAKPLKPSMVYGVRK